MSSLTVSKRAANRSDCRAHRDFLNEKLLFLCLVPKFSFKIDCLSFGFNLDFLCIHPFRDGNGRVSQLMLLLQCYQLSYEVGRYISLERLIEQNKDRYYETLAQSSEGWHSGENVPWPYINYFLYILKSDYIEFEERVGRMKGEDYLGS
jgi:hypothetical protein